MHVLKCFRKRKSYLKDNCFWIWNELYICPLVFFFCIHILRFPYKLTRQRQRIFLFSIFEMRFRIGVNLHWGFFTGDKFFRRQIWWIFFIKQSICISFGFIYVNRSVTSVRFLFKVEYDMKNCDESKNHEKISLIVLFSSSSC